MAAEKGTGLNGTYRADPGFLTHHALRIKGFATSESLSHIVAVAVDQVEEHLRGLADAGHALFREARALWQLTPDGREAHLARLAEDVEKLSLDALAPHYEAFLEINHQFKSLCGDWQLRNGGVNDHSDSAYDAAVIDRLSGLNALARPIVAAMAGVIPRLTPYGARLDAACSLVVEGTHHMFTGVMCGSFHDIWMELHEDLILTQGIDRSAEGSY